METTEEADERKGGGPGSVRPAGAGPDGGPREPGTARAMGTREAKKPEKTEKKHGLGIGSILELALCLLLVPIILVNVSIIVESYKNPDRIPGALGYMPMICLSGSMSPVFEAGDLVLIQKTPDPSALKEGDVVCYMEDASVITHRIASVQQDGDGVRYITKGDANNTEDRMAVKPEMVQGTYTGIHMTGLGDFCIFMQGTTGMLLFVICPMAVMILLDFISRWRRGRKATDRTKELEEELERLRAERKAGG